MGETITHLRKKYVYDNNYKKEHLDRIEFCVPKGYKEKIKEHAQSQGLTMAEFMKQLVYKEIGMDD